MPSSARGKPPSVAPAPAHTDPLTDAIRICITPIFFCMLVLIHAFYYIFLKVIASVRWQRHIYQQVSQRPMELLNGWRAGLGFRRAGAHTAHRASEERLLRRGNHVRTRGRFVLLEDHCSSNNKVTEETKKNRPDDSSKISKQKKRSLAPRHLALCLGEKPEHTRSLLARAALASVLQSKGREDMMSMSKKRKEEEEKEETAQIRYAIESVKTALRCCALAGVEEVSVYDEKGRIKRVLQGRKEWVLQWPLLDDEVWEGGSEEKLLACQALQQQKYSTPRSDSFSSPPSSSFSSALEATPISCTHLPSDPIDNGDDDEFGIDEDLHTVPIALAMTTTTTTTAASSPQSSSSSSRRIRLTASLQSPMYNRPKEGGERHEGSTNKREEEGVYHCSMTVHLLGPEDAKGAIASAASIICQSQDKPKVVGVQAIDEALRLRGYPSEPDLLIIHGGLRRVRTLHGFPPWLVRLCEIYHDPNASPFRPLSSISLEDAIVSFSRSEQRYGR